MLDLMSPGSDVVGILDALGAYRSARVAFLAALECPISNRDPFAEFAERLVTAWFGGTLASSRVQHTYDLLDAEGRTVQVRYLANPAGSWVNGHQIAFVPGLDRYALVVIEAFELSGVLCVDVGSLAAVCAAARQASSEAGHEPAVGAGELASARDRTLRFRGSGRVVVPSRRHRRLKRVCAFAPLESISVT
jgi:hypothetical protein